MVKEDTTQKGLRIVTINVASWSPKIVTYMTLLVKEYDILLIQEHHKIREKDMKTGPYIIASFAPAQRTVPTRNGKGWHTSGGVAINISRKRDLTGLRSKLDCADSLGKGTIGE